MYFVCLFIFSLYFILSHFFDVFVSCMLCFFGVLGVSVLLLYRLKKHRGRTKLFARGSCIQIIVIIVCKVNVSSMHGKVENILSLLLLNEFAILLFVHCRGTIHKALITVITPVQCCLQTWVTVGVQS